MSPQHQHKAHGDLTHRVRTVWTVLGRAGRTALVLAAVALAIVIVGLGRFTAVALTSPGGAKQSHAEEESQAASKFAANVENNLSQINGRSMFFDPPPPKREAPKVTDDSASRPPPPPSRYGGPTLVGFAHDTVFFGDGRKLRVGDDSDKTLKVVRTDPPWSATVLWENVEFTVSLFDKDKVVFSNHKPGDKPIEGEPSTETSEVDPDLFGPPRPPEGAVARSDATDPPNDVKPPATDPRPAPEETPATENNPPKDPNGATS